MAGRGHLYSTKKGGADAEGLPTTAVPTTAAPTTAAPTTAAPTTAAPTENKLAYGVGKGAKGVVRTVGLAGVAVGTVALTGATLLAEPLTAGTDSVLLPEEGAALAEEVEAAEGSEGFETINPNQNNKKKSSGDGAGTVGSAERKNKYGGGSSSGYLLALFISIIVLIVLIIFEVFFELTRKGCYSCDGYCGAKA